MTPEEFQYIFDKQIKTCDEMLVGKGRQYAPGEDRLHNFRQAAALSQINMKQALGGFMLKHTVSIYDMIGSDEEYGFDLWDEKITDHINYLILLRACVVEEAIAADMHAMLPIDK